MNKRFLLALGGAAFFGLLAILMAQAYIRQQTDSMIREQNTDVLVAKVDIPVGSVIQSSQIETKPLSRELAQGVLKDSKAVIGKIAIYEIPAKAPLHARYFSEGTELLPVKIQEGYRAKAVAVNEASSVAGFVQPGTWVDVISIMPAGGNRTEARTILQNIRVLASGNQMQRPSDNAAVGTRPQNFNTVTLEVTPAQAESLALAEREGSIQLVIRNPNDKNEIQTEPVNNVRYAPVMAPVTAAAPVSPRPTPSIEEWKYKQPVPVTTVAQTPTPAPTPAANTVVVYRGKNIEKHQFPATPNKATASKEN